MLKVCRHIILPNIVLLNIVLLNVALLGVSGCGSRHQAVVVERDVISERQQTERIGGQLIRIVEPGDTLYSIAFATGLDPTKVAQWNGVSDTSRLLVGQRIRLTEPPGFVAPAPAKIKAVPIGNSEKNTNSRRPSQSAPSGQTATISTSPSSNSSSSSAGATGNSSRTSVSRPKPLNPATSTPSATKNRFTPQAWQWPTSGKIVRGFNLRKGQQGIDINGNYGQAVRASQGGEVVYAGSSLKGYGKLVIVKHNDTYLSAYAHNHQILVAEGQQVVPNQTIARMGRTPRGDTALQFQIRKNGNPVDPRQFLPAR